MTDDHHRGSDHGPIDELLAGYALGALEGADAAEADRLLDEHVPGCETCRSTVEAFQAVTGELALVADPLPPPDTLLPRLRRELEPRARRRNPGRAVAVAASVLAVVGLGGLGLAQLDGNGPPLTQLSAQDLHQAIELGERADARTTSLGPATEVSAPGIDHFYVYGSDVPLPPAGSVYRLWLVGDDGADYLGDFLPTPDGAVVLRVDVDPAGWDHALVTIEPGGSEPSSPGEPAWTSAA